jgi:hypothetical protein
MSQSFEDLIREIAALKNERDEAVVRYQIADYHLERERAKCRNLEREVQMLRATGSEYTPPDFSLSEYDPPAPLRWGKGKDE